MTAPDLAGRPTVDEVFPWVLDFYAQPGNSLGGSLHIVFEDGNLRRGHIEWCRDYAIGEGDVFGAWLAGLLLRLTMSQMRRLARRVERVPDLNWIADAWPGLPGAYLDELVSGVAGRAVDGSGET